MTHQLFQTAQYNSLQQHFSQKQHTHVIMDLNSAVESLRLYERVRQQKHGVIEMMLQIVSVRYCFSD